MSEGHDPQTSAGEPPGRDRGKRPLPPRRRHETLDGQLVPYWEREAARFDALARTALLGWMARGYARRAERARAMAEASRTREIARGRGDPAGLDAGDAPSA